MTWGYGLYPIAVVEDRYDGTYTGHKWWAIAAAYPRRYEEVCDALHAGDPEIETLWRVLLNSPAGEDFTYSDGLAGGDTPDAAIAALRAKCP